MTPNPRDSDLLIPSIEEHQTQMPRAPYLVAADAGFYSATTEVENRLRGTNQPAEGMV